MIENQIKYFDEVGLKGKFRDKATEIIDFYESLYPNQLKTVFVSEYVDNEGNRHFENLWIFTDKHICEAKSFLTEDDFDSAISKKAVNYWRVKKENYDFEAATQKSRMTLSFGLTTGISGKLKASGENCDFLRELLKQYIIPNETKITTNIGIEAEQDA